MRMTAADLSAAALTTIEIWRKRRLKPGPLSSNKFVTSYFLLGRCFPNRRRVVGNLKLGVLAVPKWPRVQNTRKLEMTTAFITMSNAHKQHNKRFHGVRGQHWLVLFLLRGPGYVMVEGGFVAKQISETYPQSENRLTKNTPGKRKKWKAVSNF